jgi:hypothetical protein
MEGYKEYKGKVRWSLLPYTALEPVVRVLEYGAVTKYAMDNWKWVPHKGAYMDGILRHWVEYFEKGEEYDKESGESHLAHLACDVLFLLWDRAYSTESFEEYIYNLKKYPDYVDKIDSKKFE